MVTLNSVKKRHWQTAIDRPFIILAQCSPPIEPLQNCNEWLIKQPA